MKKISEYLREFPEDCLNFLVGAVWLGCSAVVLGAAIKLIFIISMSFIDKCEPVMTPRAAKVESNDRP